MLALLNTTRVFCVLLFAGQIGLLGTFLLSSVGCTKSPTELVTRDDGSTIVLPFGKTPSKSEVFSPEVPMEFFSGEWKSPDGQTRLNIDIATNTFSDRGEDWTRNVNIKEWTAIAGGQVLLIHNSEHTAYPNGLWYALVLLKTSEFTILMIESPNMTSVLYRP